MNETKPQSPAIKILYRYKDHPTLTLSSTTDMLCHKELLSHKVGYPFQLINHYCGLRFQLIGVPDQQEIKLMEKFPQRVFGRQS